MRNVLITGAASGIGFETACRFAAAGDRIIACDRDEKGLARLAEGCERSRILPVRLDLTELASFDAAEEAVKRAGGLDVLVNCAGICSATPLEEIGPEEWDRTYAINIRGPFFLTQRLLPFLKAGNAPCIVNVSSMAGFTGGIKSNPAYSSSKAAVSCTTKNYAKYCAQFGIRVNEVSPGTAHTQMTLGYMDDQDLKAFAARVPLGRMAEAEDIARVIVFLASEEAGFVTGQAIQVNGGMYIP